MLLDNFPAPIYAEGFQTKLPVFLHSPLHSNDIIRVEIRSSHVDLVDRDVPLGMPKDVLMQNKSADTKG